MGAAATLMRGSDSRRRRRGRGRLLPLASALGLHALLLAMVVGSKPPPMGQPSKAVDVSLISGLGQALAAAPPSPSPVMAALDPKPKMSKAADAPEAVSNPGTPLFPNPKPAPSPLINLTPILTAIVTGGPDLTAEPTSLDTTHTQASPAQNQPVGGVHCELIETLKRDLDSSDAVKTALSLIPKKSLSVANAILLWNGRWIDESDVGGPAALQPIEQSVVQTLSQTPPDCRGELLHGPRFIIVGDVKDATVLTFGSADWRWGDLIATLSPSV